MRCISQGRVNMAIATPATSRMRIPRRLEKVVSRLLVGHWERWVRNELVRGCVVDSVNNMVACCEGSEVCVRLVIKLRDDVCRMRLG